MKVVWLHPHMLYWNGGVRHIFEVSKRLKKKCDLTIMIGSISKENEILFKNNEINIIKIFNTRNFILQKLLNINGIYLPLLLIFCYYIKKIVQNYDIIISSYFPMNWFAIKSNKPVVYLFFEPCVYIYNKTYIEGLPILKRIFSLFLKDIMGKKDIYAGKKANELLTITKYSALLGQKIYQKKPIVAYPGVDAHFFQRKRCDKIHKRYLKNNVLLHSASYFTPIKGTDYLIKALPYIIKAVPNTKLLILNSEQNNKMKSKYLTLAKELSVIDHVKILPFIPDSQLPCYYSVAKVIIQPSINESFRLPLQEGNSCEIPAITFSGGSADEDVIHNKTGLIIPFGDVIKLSNGIIKILTDTKLSKRMGIEGRRRVKNIFTWEKTTEGTWDAIRKASCSNRNLD